MTPPAGGPGATALLALGTGALLFLLAALAGLVFLAERERRAAAVAFALAVLLPSPYAAAVLLEFPGRPVALAVLLVLPALVALALLVPTGRPRPPEEGGPPARFDERDVLFSRARLEPGTPRFEEYYRARPVNRAADDAFRARPGLLARGARAWHPLAFPAADAGFATIERLRPFVDGAVAPSPLPVDPAEATRFLRGWGRQQGAVAVGVAELREHHLYSVAGRGDDYGSPVVLPHRFAVALAVEMDRTMLDSAPLAPAVMESARQYVASGVMAVQMAELIRSLGHPARAHVDGAYRVVAPLVARDAGLGEIGRMGLLMTPGLGPRVRLAVVTTDLPLVPTPRRPDGSVLDVCARCRKCADACPARAIPFGPPREAAGAVRWRIDAEACYTLWCGIGTDCGRCVSVCPYSHPRGPLHDAVRAGLRRSALFRRAALLADDLFYGRRPRPKPVPGWLRTGGSAPARLDVRIPKRP
jgi:ferredoxin